MESEVDSRLLETAVYRKVTQWVACVCMTFSGPKSETVQYHSHLQVFFKLKDKFVLHFYKYRKSGNLLWLYLDQLMSWSRRFLRIFPALRFYDSLSSSDRNNDWNSWALEDFKSSIDRNTFLLITSEFHCEAVYFFINLFYLFIFGCVGSSLLCAGVL